MSNRDSPPSYVELALEACGVVLVVGGVGWFAAMSVGGMAGVALLGLSVLIATFAFFFMVDAHIKDWVRYAADNEVEI